MSGRVVVVSGGHGVLGRAIVQRMRADGDLVAIIDKVSRPDLPSASELLAELVLGGVDLTDSASTGAAIAQVLTKWGRIDVLVNVAGGFVWKLLGDGGIDAWDRMYSMNLKTAVVLTQAALPSIRESPAGKIIFVGAGAAAGKAAAGMAPYAASKVGIHKLAESLADELKDHGICVNAVLPGTLDTPQNRADMPDADRSRWVQPAALASVVHFLASREADALTGALIPVTGRA